jgi:hypothetical protein
MFRKVLLVLTGALAIGCQRDRISPRISKLMPNGYANTLINAGNQSGYARIMQLRLGAGR